LAEALADSHAVRSRPSVEVGGDGVQVEDLSLWLPSGEPLFDRCTFQVDSGKRLLVMGESGVGKTTLLRALAGLWDSGSGFVRRTESAVFLSQDPYLPEGSLRRVLTFPAEPGSFSDAQIEEAARKAQLASLLQRFSLEAVADWPVVLSRGEQQRCAFCRVLLQQPQLVVLDEATSALDLAVEDALYGALKAPCVISVSHRPESVSLHTHTLRPKGDGSRSWIFSKIQDSFEGGARAPSLSPCLLAGCRSASLMPCRTRLDWAQPIFARRSAMLLQLFRGQCQPMREEVDMVTWSRQPILHRDACFGSGIAQNYCTT
jgi:ABC-type uncharacterized transport system fused permease/ATPase subunit